MPLPPALLAGMDTRFLEVVHELVQALLMLSFAEAGQVRVEGGGRWALVAEVDLDLAEVLALLKKVRGVGMAQGMHVSVFFDAAGFEGQAEAPLQSGVLHGFDRGGRSVASSTTFGREQEGGIAMGLPLLAQQFQGALRQRHVTVAVAFAASDVDEHALGIYVADLQTQSFAQAQSAGIDGAEADAMIELPRIAEDAPDFGCGEDNGQFELGIGADQFEFVRPGAVESLFPEELECANELGGGLAGDFLDGLEVNAVLADLFEVDQFGRAVVVLAELADAGVVGLFGAGADGQKFEVIGEGF
jgi:hypothetical protein